jgi:hypothetical protein
MRTLCWKFSEMAVQGVVFVFHEFPFAFRRGAIETTTSFSEPPVSQD